jgi:2-polyprenyl-3-methyl-5-hydroxy-6-metoxy-1,4-benzoquinol methylase
MIVENEGVICSPAELCEVCGSSGKIIHSNLRDSLFSAPGVWSISRCADDACGLVWSSPRPLPDQVGKLYSTYYTHGTPELMPENYRSKGSSRVLKSILAKTFFWKSAAFQTDLLHLQGARVGRLLDVGCGSGEFLGVAAMEGWDCEGLDFDPEAVSAANKLPGVRARTGELISASYAASSFDAIVMNNLIEHVWNPKQIIAECHRILAPGGRLVVITPNTDALGHTIFERSWRGLECPRHLFIFNRNSLTKLSVLAGFKKKTVFSSPGDYVSMLQASLDMAKRTGHDVQAVASDFRKIGIKEALGGLLGQSRGEWVVMVAQK